MTVYRLVAAALVASLVDAAAAASTNDVNTTNTSTSGASITGSPMGNTTFNSDAPKYPTSGPASVFLTSSGDVCMGSAGGSVSTTVFAVSMGTTWVDEACVIRRDARELWNMGLQKAAVFRLCMNDGFRTALEDSGFGCPPKRGAQQHTN